MNPFGQVSRFPAARRGFTLIELLVVVGIIALLIAILLPSLARSRALAKDVVRTSNVRQITLGLTTYATSYHNYFPAAQEPPTLTGPTWHVRIWDFIFNRSFNVAYATAPYDYLKKTVFECPQADLTSRIGLGGYDETDHRRNGYGLNVNTPGDLGQYSYPNVDTDTNARIMERKLLQRILRPSETLLLTDAQGFYVQYFDRGRSLNQISSLSQNPNTGRMLDAVGRHGRTKDVWNMAFYDGSVRPLHFIDVPGTPDQYYNLSSRLSTSALQSASDVAPATKVFWCGRSN